MRVFVPYTRLSEATKAYLEDKTVEMSGELKVEFVDVSRDRWAYTDFLQSRWDEGEAFINVEHDIVPWPGSLTAMKYCPCDWCFYGYIPGIDCVENNCAPFGAVKFSSRLIAQTPNIWREMREYYADYEFVWQHHDTWMFNYVVELKKTRSTYSPHQHWPPVFNPSYREKDQ